MNGILNLLKPAGMTSHDAVAFVRRQAGLKKVGHIGTLDPMAAGVLPVCLGSATRLAEYLETDGKNYRCILQLGLTTDTHDIWGTALTRAGNGFPKKSALVEVLQQFQGEIRQVPPMYSALKHKGKKLYEYARDGKEVERTPRSVFIKYITVKQYDASTGAGLLDVSCSKGTYIRTLCHDIGQKLGVGGVMSFLLRTRSGIFELNHTATPEEVMSDLASRLIRPAEALPEMPAVALEATRGARFLQGLSTVRAAVLSADRSGENDSEKGGDCGEKTVCRVFQIPAELKKQLQGSPAGDLEAQILKAGVFLGIGRLEGERLRVEKVLADGRNDK